MKRFYSNILIIAILIGSLIICSDGFAGQTYFDPVSGRMNSLPSTARFGNIVVDGLLSELAALTPTTNALLGFNGSGNPVNVTSISVDVVVPVQESITAGTMGRTTTDMLTMGNNAADATLYLVPRDDTAGDGDTAKTWSADKTFDELALKQAALTGAESLSLTNKTIDHAGTGNNLTMPLVGANEVIFDPADSDDFIWLKLQFDTTVTDIHCLAQGGGTITLTLQECTSAGASCADIEGAITCDDDGAEDDGTLTDGALDAGDWIKVLFGAPSGTVDSLAWKVYGTQVW